MSWWIYGMLFIVYDDICKNMTLRITMYHDSDDMTMIATIKPGDDEEIWHSMMSDGMRIRMLMKAWWWS